MNRINCFASVRGLALAIALATFGGAFGCAGQTTEGDVQGTEPSRHSHLVNTGGSDNAALYDGRDGRDGVNVAHSLDSSKAPLHPQTGANLGPRPEPWMDDDGNSSGPRPEPWHRTNTDEGPSSPEETTPATGTGTTTGTDSPWGGGTSSSSGGSPGNPATK